MVEEEEDMNGMRWTETASKEVEKAVKEERKRQMKNTNINTLPHIY